MQNLSLMDVAQNCRGKLEPPSSAAFCGCSCAEDGAGSDPMEIYEQIQISV